MTTNLAWTCPRCDRDHIAHGATEAVALAAFIAFPGCECGRPKTPPAAPGPGKAGQQEAPTSGTDALPHPTRSSDANAVPDSAGDGLGVVARLSDLAGRLFWWLVVPGAWAGIVAFVVGRGWA